MAFQQTIGYQNQDMTEFGGPCPCEGTGTFVCIEINDLNFEIICWCGRRRAGTFDSEQERADVISRHE